MLNAENVGDASLASSSFPVWFSNMPGFIGHYAVQFFSADYITSVVQSIPVMYVYAFLITAPFLIGMLRVVWPFLESWIIRICVRLSGTASALSSIQRNIIVQLPPSASVEVPNYNVLLQNAVMMYVCHHLWRQKSLRSYPLLRCAQAVDLIDPYRTWRADVSSRSPFQVGTALGSKRRKDSLLNPNELDRLRLVKLPQKSWVPVMSDDIEIYFNEEPMRMSNYTHEWTRRTLSLRCRATPGAAQRLDRFVQRALELFAEGAPGRENSDKTRWFFTYGGDSGDKVYFDRYVLRSNKDFDTLFFPQRDATVSLVDQFLHRRGRFAVEGFPQRLGFLVYGPPGTGRHTFVKALAAYTGRHIVSVPLSKLRTNQQLYDIFFVREFQSEEDEGAQKLLMEDVIFLFDDVDAADTVVCARAERRVVQRRAAARLTACAEPRKAALTNCLIEMDTSSSLRPVVHTEESELPLELLMGLMGAMSGGAASAEGGDGGGGGSVGEKAKEKRAAAAPPPVGADAEVAGRNLLRGVDLLLGENKDKLDLAGLLNVLDGVVDAPGRIVVMITEHPEWLDPALIRPGRFSVRLRLDYMEMEALVRMLGLYYGDVTHSPRGHGTCAGDVGTGVDGGVEAAHAARCPTVAGVERAVHRELSEAQVARVRGFVAALEAEAAAAHKAEAAAAHKAAANGYCGGGGGKYRFQVTPCEVEMLCMEQDDLEGFLTQLAGVVRGTAQL
ncbi:hypothetical protein JKF63_04414 [Porcisia hertigi]|uniref:AAA+ ATPase domain-containing protein n=1 Tax=Porcisia hertigi TaxID=2761500 RepID=A0A836LC96_9TRYP|nr:hypothetical protein JKF63_04414 [Porcisia hertigi]